MSIPPSPENSFDSYIEGEVSKHEARQTLYMDEEKLPCISNFFDHDLRSEERKVVQKTPGSFPATSSDIEFLKFLNFNTNLPPAPKFDFEITEQKLPTWSSENEESSSKRSRSREKHQRTNLVTGSDLRRLFGDEKLISTRREDTSGRCLGKKTAQKREHQYSSKIENEIAQEFPNNGKRTAAGQTPGPQEAAKCSCTKSRCLKLYCTCYSSGVPCSEQCACRECLNTEQLFREGEQRQTKTEACCNCKMTYCEKNYCTCARNQKGCSSQCSCYACKNMFGIKPKK